MAVEAGENCAGRHHFAGLVPAVSVAEPGSISLTFLIQNGVQPGQQHKEKGNGSTRSISNTSHRFTKFQVLCFQVLLSIDWIVKQFMNLVFSRRFLAFGISRTYFQSLAIKYCSSSSLCSQSSTIFSVYRCSIRQDRILQEEQHIQFNLYLGRYRHLPHTNTA